MNSKYNIVWFESLASTQAFMETEPAFQEKEWSVVATTNQQQGKGQGENKWESQKGKNIAFSLFLMPDFINADRQFVLTQMYSLGICDMLSKYVDAKRIKIKWPNDIYIGQNKVCGMLVSNKIIGNSIFSSISGIGINVNQTEFYFAPNPTSIKIEAYSENDIDIKEVLSCALESIEKRYAKLKKDGIDTYKDEYLSKLLYYGEWKKYLYHESCEVEAKISDVNLFGHLILTKRDQKDLVCELKEVKFLHR